MLTAILRELISNALRHGHPHHLLVRLQPAGNLLQLQLTQYGPCQNPELWQEGFGLRSLRGRLHELGGSMSLSRVEPEQLNFRLLIPFDQGVVA
jgi:signal transduction histidine kinase